MTGDFRAHPVVNLVFQAKINGLIGLEHMALMRSVTGTLYEAISVSEEVASQVLKEVGSVAWNRQFRHIASLEARHWYQNPDQRLAGVDVKEKDKHFHVASIGVPRRVIWLKERYRVALPPMEVPTRLLKARALFFVCVRMMRLQVEKEGRKRGASTLGVPP